MDFLNYKIIYTIAILAITMLIRLMATKSLKKIQLKFGFQKARILVDYKNNINPNLLFGNYIYIFNLGSR